jgi:hypothetical protein
MTEMREKLRMDEGRVLTVSISVHHASESARIESVVVKGTEIGEG